MEDSQGEEQQKALSWSGLASVAKAEDDLDEGKRRTIAPERVAHGWKRRIEDSSANQRRGATKSALPESGWPLRLQPKTISMRENAEGSRILLRINGEEQQKELSREQLASAATAEDDLDEGKRRTTAPECVVHRRKRRIEDSSASQRRGATKSALPESGWPLWLQPKTIPTRDKEADCS
ncbi:Hypothetical predicted protein [Xyrichtys novacula]|uniref:Uncharacterized protein n=1 Tax=Xyrichtys novacula TaxID=13765 RepID=A0AAV1G251_XYRNO|nr:Hypothetical predicted protein [Xyrichtys novacula]